MGALVVVVAVLAGFLQLGEERLCLVGESVSGYVDARCRSVDGRLGAP